MVSLSAHLLSHFLGKLSAVTQAIPPAPLFFHCLQRDSQQQQSGLRGSSVPITTHPRKTFLVERTPFQMEWEAPKGQVRSSYHQLRCLPTRLGVACVKNCTGGTWSVQEQTMHINCLEYLAAMLATKTFLKDISGYRWTVAYINNMGSTVSAS